MALWGAKDNIDSVGTVSLDYDTLVVTGSGTSFGQVGSASTGDVIRFGDRAGVYYGDAVIVGIASTTQVSIARTSGLSGAAIASTSFTVSQLPKYTTRDPHYSKLANINTTYDALVYGADTDETQALSGTTYALTHAGWVGITTYTSDGNLRVKTETLVAMSSIESDAADDAVLPDATIVILSQPTSVGIDTTETAEFSVSAITVPTGKTLSYQWQESSGGAYSNLTESSPYSDVDSDTLTITGPTTALSGNQYRVVVSVDGGFDVTSESAVLTVIEAD